MKSETEKLIGDWMQFSAFKNLENVSKELGILYQTKKIYPAPENIFKAFELTQYKDLKVIILGQCPYHTEYKSRRDGKILPHATGLAFGNGPLVPELSPSLKLIKKSVIDCGYMMLDESLESWANMGVLMLNSALTVEHGQPNSHNALWSNFTKELLTELSNKTPGMIYLLIGSVAGKYYDCLNPFTSNIITVEHPSRALHEGREWRSEQCWKTVNELLWKIEKSYIRW